MPSYQEMATNSVQKNESIKKNKKTKEKVNNNWNDKWGDDELWESLNN